MLRVSKYGFILLLVVSVLAFIIAHPKLPRPHVYMQYQADAACDDASYSSDARTVDAGIDASASDAR